MIFWYWYLLASAALSFAGYLTLNIFLAGLLAALVHVPFQLLLPRRARLVKVLRAALAAAAALALAWRESFLPPFTKLAAFLADPLTRPSAEYLLAFVRQSVNVFMLAAGAGLLAAVYFANRKKPLALAIAAYLALFGAWLLQPKQTVPDLGSESPEAFYKKESARVVAFPAPARNDQPFDIIVLHICSLSWQDTKDSGSDLLPFLSRFDYVFTNFGAGCSYSGPAALRVLKSACGQLPHPLLYADSAPGCYLMDDLRAAGYKTFTMFSHDGKYARFAQDVQKYGHADAPLGVAGLPVEYHMFDGTPLYADNAALHKFWLARQASGAPRAALYYNTANLHIGTHKAGGSRGSDDAASYKDRLSELASQLEDFFAEVERSGRSAVVVFVPEHGAALTGNKMQAKDVREIPLPPIATLPVAVKLIGKKTYAGGPQVITKPSSLMALAWLEAEFLRHDPFGRGARTPEVIASELPGTDFLAENENAAVMRLGLGYIYRKRDGGWSPLPAYAGIRPGVIPSPEEIARAAK